MPLKWDESRIFYEYLPHEIIKKIHIVSKDLVQLISERVAIQEYLHDCRIGDFFKGMISANFVWDSIFSV